ncbi:ankyrin repeat domain-containing protein 28 protein [Purpureocillium lilacinum]|uniref:Ankyrin repeat domain-containing protein 28 protein n=1 Tax=Purpureocillium lilacinum TaxID=33203 RepID=A0A179GJZ6_PURLI|nr:ankyrin repeat domain-containing protein 28 protein [Purpureocillium lilacinum]
MAWLLLLGLVLALVPAVAGDDDLADFSNNLATDIGPLLALFGDAMTRQYLSESITFLDYLIFALGPIGILTAIVSVARLCGHSTLRAFIGRSQEGETTVEAELCTSTSRDVCELFTKGGITRVIGRANILELIYFPPITTPTIRSESHRPAPLLSDALPSNPLPSDALSSESRPSIVGKSPLGAYIDGAISAIPIPGGFELVPFQQFVRIRQWVDNEETISWRQVGGHDDRNGVRLAPRPNLSLNVGIKKQPDWVFYTVAAVGVLLQSFIIAFTAMGTWAYDWNIRSKGSSASQNYAPSMFIIGTCLLAVGMCSCATLIGQTTKEVQFRRDGSSKRSGRLMWLQPGPTVVGDQSFDAFAYLDSQEKPLQYWTSSRKELNPRFETFTFLAVAVTLVGYFMQFIGLRGMKAWVSLAQLAVTIIMSMLRGLLRIQRLGKDDNRLDQMPDMVSGHELDWLAFELALWERYSDCSITISGSPFWILTGQSFPAGLETPPVRTGGSQHRNGSTYSGSSSASGPYHRYPHRESRSKAAEHLVSEDADSRQVDWAHLLQVRARLAEITTHDGAIVSGAQEWRQTSVANRKRAKSLCTALCTVADTLLQGQQQNQVLLLYVDFVAAPRGLGDCDRGFQKGAAVVRVQNTHGRWEVDPSEIEAILCTYAWSLMTDKRFQYRDDFNNILSATNASRKCRIISGVSASNTLVPDSDRVGELQLWAGADMVQIQETTLSLCRNVTRSLMDLWVPQGSSGDPQGPECDAMELEYNHGKGGEAGSWPSQLRHTRFSGWGAVSKAISSKSETNATGMCCHKQARVRVQFAYSILPLPILCTQELFAALVRSLTELITFADTGVVERAGVASLDNPTINAIIEPFVENDLGTRSDALLSILPGYWDEVRPKASVLLTSLVATARSHRRDKGWDKAAILLRWGCQQFSHRAGWESQQTEPHFIQVLRETAELYRWSLAVEGDQERHDFGVTGIQWLHQTYFMSADSERPDRGLVAETLDPYLEVLEGLSEQTPWTRDKLMEAFRERDRPTALLLLTLAQSDGFEDAEMEAALPLAARNKWPEVIDTTLDCKPIIDGRDESGRTAVSYCAELGWIDYLKKLVEMKAFIDQADNELRSPLHWAAGSGQQHVVQYLLQSGHVDLMRHDVLGQTPLSHAAKAGHVPAMALLLRRGANSESKDKDGRTALSLAAGGGHHQAVMELANRKADILSEDDAGRQPMHWACKSGNVDTVAFLIGEGADVAARDKSKSTPLTWAASAGKVAVVEFLLGQGAAIDWKDGEDRTPISRAAGNGHLDVVKCLHSKGADIKIPDNRGALPILWAASSGHTSVVEQLIEYKADVSYTAWGGLGSPLTQAAVGGHEAVVEALLNAGADVDRTVTENNTALTLAARFGQLTVVRKLVEHGRAKVNHMNEQGHSPLIEAIKDGHESVVDYLIEHGADCDHIDEVGRSPLFFAAARGRTAIALRLLEQGVDVNWVNYRHETALSVAVERGHTELAELLRSWANKP